jgi:hypothetical protein
LADGSPAVLLVELEEHYRVNRMNYLLPNHRLTLAQKKREHHNQTRNSQVVQALSPRINPSNPRKRIAAEKMTGAARKIAQGITLPPEPLILQSETVAYT